MPASRTSRSSISRTWSSKHVPAEIVVTPSNDPRTYRVNSDRLLATGFRPKKTVEDAINEIDRHVLARAAEERGPLVQSEVDAEGSREMSATTAFPIAGHAVQRLLRAPHRDVCEDFDWAPVERLAHDLLDCWQHRAPGVPVPAMAAAAATPTISPTTCSIRYRRRRAPACACIRSAANPAVLTCLANDEGYDQHLLAAARGAGARGRRADRAVRFGQFAEHPQGAGRSQDASA